MSLKTAILSDDPEEGRLDQSQSQFNIGKILFTRDNQSDYIQSFRPTLPVITRIELYLGKRGNPSFDEICVSIKNGLYGGVLASDYKTMDEIPENASWVNFEFGDIRLSSGMACVILVEVIGSCNTSDCLVWYISQFDPYEYGNIFTRLDEYLEVFESTDACFKSYGKRDIPPNDPSTPVAKKMFRIDHGIPGWEYVFATSTTDSDRRPVFYFFDWVDGNDSGWLGPLNSGQEAIAVHSFKKSGTYELRVKACNIPYYTMSDWSEPSLFHVEIPKLREIIEWFLVSRQ